MKFKKEFELILKDADINYKILDIQKITEGLSHQTYKIVTTDNNYALKKINQSIIKENELYTKFTNAERISNIMKNNGINAVTSIKSKTNNYIFNINSSFYMLFHWIEGKILNYDLLTNNHCEIIGKTLANMHNIDFSDINLDIPKKINIIIFDWNKLYQKAKKQNKSYINLFSENINLLYEINKKAKEFENYMNKDLVISHLDLNMKNIIWQFDEPYIIDWENSGYINPTMELIQISWYWSGMDIGKPDFEKYEIILKSYKKYINRKVDKNIKELLYTDIYGGLEWLFNNFERSLNNENDKNDVEIAEKEIVQSFKEIKFNLEQMDNIINIFEKVF